MKEDIKVDKVENVGVAIIKEKNEKNEDEWNVYLINNKKETIELVMVSSRGYGEIDNKKLRTSEFRHSLGDIGPQGFIKFEPIMEDVFKIANEYLVTFFIQSKMYDRKYVFLPESIKEDHLSIVPVINKPGILIM